MTQKTANNLQDTHSHLYQNIMGREVSRLWSEFIKPDKESFESAKSFQHFYPTVKPATTNNPQSGAYRKCVVSVAIPEWQSMGRGGLGGFPHPYDPNMLLRAQDNLGSYGFNPRHYESIRVYIGNDGFSLYTVFWLIEIPITYENPKFTPETILKALHNQLNEEVKWYWKQLEYCSKIDTMTTETKERLLIEALNPPTTEKA